MECYWIDPPPNSSPDSPTERSGMWDIFLDAALPTERHVVRPLHYGRIMIAGPPEPRIVPAVWGLVPTWAIGRERRELAGRNLKLDADLVADSSTIGDLWRQQRPTRRCLVPASGWLDPEADCPSAFSPIDRPVTFAGLHSSVITDERSVYTFGILGRRMNVGPFTGQWVPLVVSRDDRPAWLASEPREALRALRRAPPNVAARPVRRAAR